MLKINRLAGLAGSRNAGLYLYSLVPRPRPLAGGVWARDSEEVRHAYGRARNSVSRMVSEH